MTSLLAPRGLAALGVRWGAAILRWVAKAAVVVGLWQALVVIARPSPIAVPSPGAVARALEQLVKIGFVETSLWAHIAASAQRLAVAEVLTVLIGIPLGVAMANVPGFRSLITPIINFFRPLPSFAWLAVLVVWLGFGDASKIAVVFVATVTILALGTTDGILRVPPHYRDAARVLGANRAQSLVGVVLPAALPQVLSSARVALTVAWAALIAAELVAAGSGIGVIIIQSARFLRTDQTFAGLIILALLGWATDQVLARLEERVAPWGNR